MDGLDKLMPKGKRDAVKGPVRVQISAPISFAADTDVSEATRDLRRAMEHLRRECRDIRHVARAEAARNAA